MFANVGVSIFTRQVGFAQIQCVLDNWMRLIRKKTHLKNMVVTMPFKLNSDKTEIQPYRFHCEELTAQTDSEERPYLDNGGFKM